MMNWDDAEKAIRSSMRIGTDLNSPNSTHRFVKKVDVPIDSQAYGYRNERGYVVTIGSSPSATISIPWSMLKACFLEAQSQEGYSGVTFRRLYPKQARVHPCHVHVVGQFLEVAGLARLTNGAYRSV